MYVFDPPMQSSFAVPSINNRFPIQRTFSVGRALLPGDFATLQKVGTGAPVITVGPGA